MQAVIFLTGAVILALELITSRVLAPFFGVSLYIWTGILSTTLLCLAYGYSYGGQLARRSSHRTLAFIFYLLPAVAGIATAVSSALYPFLLGPLARFDLLFGSFLACLLLLGVPLVALSALNPILIAIESKTTGRAADGGAGKVLFISTLGSVAGVLAAAFYFIPHWSNILSLSQIGALLGMLSLVGASSSQVLSRHRLWLAVSAAMTIIGSSSVFFAWSRETGQPYAGATGQIYTVVGHYPSAFGALKIVDIKGEDTDLRMLLNDGISQNYIYRDGRSASAFTYILDIVTAQLVAHPRRVLVLGLGAGMIPMMYASRGVPVDVVEINPRTSEVAARYFGLDQRGMSLVIGDARTFVNRCNQFYDLVIVDLFVGDGIPDHLTTKEFFQDVQRCLSEVGVVGVNSFLDPRHPSSYGALVATIIGVFGDVGFLYVPLGVAPTNGFVVAGQPGRNLEAVRYASANALLVPPGLRSRIGAALGTIEIVDRSTAFVLDQPVLSDADNRIGVLSALAKLAYRSRVLNRYPDALLVN